MSTSNHANGPKPATLPGAPPGVEPWALTITAAMAVTGLSRATFYREAARSNITFLKLGRSTLVDMHSMRRFMDALPRATVGQSRRARAAADAAGTDAVAPN